MAFALGIPHLCRAGLMSAPRLAALDHLVLTVADIGATCRFYADMLGMEVQQFQPPAGGPRRTALAFGAQKINLHPASAPFLPGAEVPMPGSADLCFLSETPLQDWIAHLAGAGVAIEEGPVARSGATGPLSSIYIRDPDGNLIEISNI